MLRVLARQIGTMLLALGVLLSGAVDASAMPSHPVMQPHTTVQKMATMQVAVGHGGSQMADCAAGMARPVHKHPANNCCKDMGFACAMFGNTMAGLVQSTSTILPSFSAVRTTVPRDLSENGIREQPALPPPIARI